MAVVRTIAVINQKGGVGKTTTVVNLGAALAQRGLNVCLVDLDPQAHLSMHFGIDPKALRASIYDVMIGQIALGQAAILVEPHLMVVPSVIDLAAAEVELAGEVGREQVLRDRVAAEELPHDLILIDCPPSLGLLTLNALSAADEVLIPLQPHFLALQGLGRLLQTIALVQQRINSKLSVTGVVFCMFESGTRLASEVVEDVRQFLASAKDSGMPWSEARTFRTRIRRNIKLAECPSYGTTILRYDPSSHGAEDHLALAEEFLHGFAPERAAAGSRDSSAAEGAVAAAGSRPGGQYVPSGGGVEATGNVETGDSPTKPGEDSPAGGSAFPPVGEAS